MTDLFYWYQPFVHFCQTTIFMKLYFWSVGKTNEPYVKEGIELFTARIANYYPVEWQILAPLKNAAKLSEAEQKKKEGMRRANYKWSLSPLVFPHQLVRLILAEQVYRACSIIRNEKYHHQ